jgi:hypothetical protein
VFKGTKDDAQDIVEEEEIVEEWTGLKY